MAFGFLNLVLLLDLLLSPAHAVFDKLGKDLASFVTRPELRPPLLNITTHLPDLVTPGYWFYTPYDNLISIGVHRSYFPAQTGPHIFDHHGNLVWSGAFEYGAGSVSDFKVVTVNGQPHLSFIDGPRADTGSIFEGEGIVLDQAYSVKTRVKVTGGDEGFNMHEFQVLNNGKTALAQSGTRKLVDYSDFGFSIGPGSGYIGDAAFMEIDIATGREIFRWESSEHVTPNASYTEPSSFNTAWDFFHMNSVDKNADGDYLISSRFNSCIYKISGKDGSIIWRLGGKESDFKLDGFNFSSQHHARFHEQEGTTTIISFLNNASDMSNTNHSETSSWSSAFFVQVDLSTMKASLLRRYDRPDHRLSRLRGAVQTLPGDNVFVSWSDNGYASEFTVGGDLVQEVGFSSTRLVDYRAYKFNFTAYPKESPVLKAFAYGASNTTITTVIYVSWDGATEVTNWRFYQALDLRGQEVLLLGTAAKTGFETIFVAEGYATWVYAEAVAITGEALGKTDIEETGMQSEWWFEASHEKASALAIPARPFQVWEEQHSPEQGISLEYLEQNGAIGLAGCSAQRIETTFSIGWVLLVAFVSCILLASILELHFIAQQRRWWLSDMNFLA